jgi:hypothetical protein
MEKNKITFLLIVSFFLFSTQSSIIAADKKDNIKVLVIKNKRSGKIKHIKVGRRVVLWTSSATKVKGVLENVSENTITVNGKEYTVSSIEAVRVRHIGAKITGGIVGGGGLIGTISGMFLYLTGLSEGGCGGGFAMIFGIILGTISAFVLAIGLLIFFAGKKYKFKRWEFSTTQISE